MHDIKQTTLRVENVEVSPQQGCALHFLFNNYTVRTDAKYFTI